MEHFASSPHFKTSFPLQVMEASHSGTMKAHSHEFWEMVYVRSGRGEHWIEETAYPIQAGDLYVIAPGEYHRYAPLANETVRIVNVLWRPDLVAAILRGDLDQGRASLGYVDPLLRQDLRFAQRLHLQGRTAFRVEVLLDEMRREQVATAAGHELMLRHLFCALLVLLSRAHAAQHRPGMAADGEESEGRLSSRQIVAAAVAYLEENAAGPVQIQDLARHVGLSNSRICHVFKEHTGRSVIAYLHEIRIARASALLVSGQSKIEAIAQASGFADIRFFTRIFVRHTGTTPSAYRRRFGAA